MPDINLVQERKHNVLNELTSTVGEVFLGLQIGCAQCHDHKYDPISQSDYPVARLLSRYPRWRLQAEAIRDAMLASSSQINFKMAGPGVQQPLPDELVQTLLKNQWKVTRESNEHFRRSIYVFACRNLRFPILEAFDRPNSNSNCAMRDASTTASRRVA